MHRVGLVGFEPDLLLLNRVVLVQLLKRRLSNVSAVHIVMIRRLSDLLSVYGLFFVVEKADALLLHHTLDGLLDFAVVEGKVDVLGVPLTNLLAEFLVELHADLFHDFQVGSLSHLRNHLATVFVVKVRLRFPSGLLQFVLGDLLIKDLFEELIQVFLGHLVVKFTAVGLDNVAAAG